MDNQELIVISVSEGSVQTPSNDLACRLCLEKNAEILDIFNVERMSEKLHAFLQIEVTSTDPWPMGICPPCVSKINTWEAYYEHVRKNEASLRAIKGDETDSGMLYQVETFAIQSTDDQVPGNTMDKYTLVCVPKLEELQNLNSESLIEEEILEEDSVRNQGSEFVVSDFGDDDDDEETIQGEESQEEEMGEDEIIEEEEERPTRPKQKSENKPSHSRGRPKKDKKPHPTLDYLTTRDSQDELIRQTLSLDCDICFETAGTFEELLGHYREIHNVAQGYVKCCEKTFKRRYVLLEHVKLHLNPDQYACPKCQKRFSTKRHLSDHVLLHIPEEERQFQCETCQKRYATAARLQVHMRSHNEDLSFECLYCEKSFRQEVILKNHIKSVHEGSNQHICEICAKVFKTKEGFLIHQVQHLEIPPERLKCEVCGGKYKNKDSLKYHMLRHKRAHERYNCDVCNKEFTSKKRMSAHRKYVHATESQLFQCTLCDKAFKRPIVLKEHMAAHTGMLLYKCAYCPKQFNSNANKYSHQKAQHPVEWQLARELKMAA